MSAVLPDAARTNWVDRYAPEALRPWLKLGRFDRPAGIWLLMLPGWQGIALADAAGGRWPDPRLLFLFAAGACAMRAAGCAWNDVVDRDLDRRVARTAERPVASGRISRKAAVAYATALTAFGAAVLLFLPLVCFWLALLSLVLVGAYPFMKRITWWPQAWLGLTFNWGALMGFAAALPAVLVGPALWRLAELGSQAPTELDAGPVYSPDLATWAAPLLLYASGVFWTLGYDTIYAAQDLEDDALVGVKSSTRRLGARAPAGVAVFYVLSVALAGAAGFVAGLGPVFYAGLALFAAHLAWQASRFRPADGPGALRLFKANREAGLILVLAIAAGFWRP